MLAVRPAGDAMTDDATTDGAPAPAPGGVSRPAWREALPALAAALAFGASTPAVKGWLSGLPDLFVAGWLYLTSGIGLAAYRWLRRRTGTSAPEAPLRREDLPWLAGAILCGGVIAPIAYVRGVSVNAGHVTSMLLNLEAVLTAVLAVVLFREHLDGRRRAGIALIVVAGALYAWAAAGPASKGGVPLGRAAEGAAWVALACLGWGLDNNLTRRVSAKDPAQIACWKGLVGGSVSLLLAASVGAWPSPRAAELAKGAAIGFVCYGLSLVLFIHGLRRLGASRTAALFGTAPFLGVLLSAAALGEALSVWTAVVGVATAAGVALLTFERHAHEHAHEATEHEHLHVHDPLDEHHRHAHRGDEGEEPHAHAHRHEPRVHSHPHRPDLHHRHGH